VERAADNGTDHDSWEPEGAPGEVETSVRPASEPKGPENRVARFWWVILIRGCVALLLGLSVFAFDARRAGLANFIGLYWLVGALLTIRWALANRWIAGSKLGLAAGVVGLAAAVVTLARFALTQWLSPAVFVDVLGGVVLVVGLMRLAGAMRDDQVSGARPRLRHRILLGALDTGLGLLLLITALESRVLSLGAALWALVGGTVLLIDALSLRRVAMASEHRAERSDED
jgi:uncharacterized membrane protein HdeD (DUF308 family)